MSEVKKRRRRAPAQDEPLAIPAGVKAEASTRPKRAVRGPTLTRQKFAAMLNITPRRFDALVSAGSIPPADTRIVPVKVPAWSAAAVQAYKQKRISQISRRGRNV